MGDRDRRLSLTELAPHPAPHRPVPPGELLRAELDARRLTRATLAAKSGLSAAIVDQLLRGVRPVTAEVAIGLGKALRMPPELWLRVEANYQMDVVRARRRRTRRPAAA